MNLADGAHEPRPWLRAYLIMFGQPENGYCFRLGRVRSLRYTTGSAGLWCQNHRLAGHVQESGSLMLVRDPGDGHGSMR